MQIIFTRSNAIDPDPRLEKEVRTLLDNGYIIQVLGWDRSGKGSYISTLNIGNHSIQIKQYCGKAIFGGGIKNLKELLLFQFFLIRELFKIRNSIKLIHAADFDTVIPATLIKLLLGKKVIYDIYDFYVDAFSVPEKAKPFIKMIDLCIISFVDAVILTNESRLEQIRGSRPKRIEIIHNTPEEVIPKNLELPINHQKKQDYSITVAYVGILQDGRLLLEVLDIFKRNSGWQLIVAGFGKYKNHFIEAAMKHNNIIFLGKVSYERSLSVSNYADLLFATYDPRIPNHRYSSPNKIYEAMMLGKPIIVCNNTGIDNLIVEQEIGWAIDYSSVAFEATVRDFVLNKDNALIIKEKSKFSYHKNYKWKIMSERLLVLYKELLNL